MEEAEQREIVLNSTLSQRKLRGLRTLKQEKAKNLPTVETLESQRSDRKDRLQLQSLDKLSSHHCMLSQASFRSFGKGIPLRRAHCE
jgi:hypothetical protein